MPVCWGELEAGDVLRWKVSTVQGSALVLVVTNRFESDLYSVDGSGTRHSSVVEFLDMESGKVRRHECDNAVFLRDMNANVLERGHAQGA